MKPTALDMTEIRQLREIARRFPRLLEICSVTGNSWASNNGYWQQSEYPSRDPRLIASLEMELFNEKPLTLAQRWERILNHLNLK